MKLWAVLFAIVAAIITNMAISYWFSAKWMFVLILTFIEILVCIVVFFIYERTGKGVGWESVIIVLCIVFGMYAGYYMNFPPRNYVYVSCADYWAVVHYDRRMGECTQEAMMAEIDGYQPIAGHDYRGELKDALSKDLDELWRAEKKNGVVQTFPRFRQAFGVYLAAYSNEARDRLTGPAGEMSDVRSMFFLVLFGGFIINNLLSTINLKAFGVLQIILATLAMSISVGVWKNPNAAWRPEMSRTTEDTLYILWNTGFIYGLIPSLLGFIPQIGSKIVQIPDVAKYWLMSLVIVSAFGALAFFLDPRFQEIFMIAEINRMVFNDPNLNIVACVWALLLGMVPGMSAATFVSGGLKFIGK